jgi:hypothetical protein
MIKLIDLLKEEEDLALEKDLDKIDDIIKRELENAAKNNPTDTPQLTNEVILSGVALALAVPGIIKGFTNIVEVIAKKRGINLKKKGDPAWYKVIGDVASKVDEYLDSPIRFVLKPFISDEQKRNQIAGILKAVVLAVMAILGAVDLNSVKSVKDVIVKVAGNSANEIIQAVAEKSLPKLTEIVKTLITTK